MTKYSDDELLSIAIGVVDSSLIRFEGINDPLVIRHKDKLEQCLALLREIKGEGVGRD